MPLREGLVGMPLYDLAPEAAAGLAAYLRSLGSEPDPGVEEDVLHVATVVTPDVDPAHAGAMIEAPLAAEKTVTAPGGPNAATFWPSHSDSSSTTIASPVATACSSRSWSVFEATETATNSSRESDGSTRP